MVADIPPDILALFPAEQAHYAADQAACDADRVVAHLTAVGLADRPGQNCKLPPGILLDLGAILRMRAWETAGLTVHRDAGLPSAEDAMEILIDTLFEAARNSAALARTGILARDVFRVAMTRFAWSGPVEMNAEVALHIPNEDALIDALAQLLWANRRRPVPAGAAT